MDSMVKVRLAKEWNGNKAGDIVLVNKETSASLIKSGVATHVPHYTLKVHNGVMGGRSNLGG